MFKLRLEKTIATEQAVSGHRRSVLTDMRRVIICRWPDARASVHYCPGAWRDLPAALESYEELLSLTRSSYLRRGATGSAIILTTPRSRWERDYIDDTEEPLGALS